MTYSDVMWLALGWATGVLTWMQVDVLLSWRARRRHPMSYAMKWPKVPAPVADHPEPLDWDTAAALELDPIPVTEPVPAPPALAECVQCGRAFKPRGLPIHTARAHKVTTP